MIIDADLLRHVQSAEARRFAWVHEQNWDTSCGYASVASLLELYWNRQTSEQDLIDGVSLPAGEPFTLSLAAAQGLIEKAGLEARGYRLSWEQLERAAALHAPVLVHFDRPRKHFALLLGIEKGRVVVADPARGLEVLSQEQFAARWSGAVLLAGSKELVRNDRALESALDTALDRAELLEAVARQGRGGGP